MDVRAECGKRRVDDLAPYDHDDVERPAAGCDRPVWFRLSKNLAHAPLGAIPDHCRADLSRGDDPEAIRASIVRPADERHIARSNASPALLHRLKFLTRTQPDPGTEPGGQR
ncbi:MAG TPA: hypothetical protein VLT86_01390 [Vicinamibacterales bacterium]|nr:hypothetical protein [Vicinamibacterales bacterium]